MTTSILIVLFTVIETCVGHRQRWTDIFRCVDNPGSDIEFYGWDLEDIQSLIVESNSNQIMISGYFGSEYVILTSKPRISCIISETVLNGKSISTFDFNTRDWMIWPSLYRNILNKNSNCLTETGSYIPNIWYKACGNDDGLFIVRNASQSLCTFKKMYNNIIPSDITISINSNSFPSISNIAINTVFDNLDEYEQTLTQTLFPNLTFIATDDYQNTIQETCLIDVRDENEWSVSRIESTVTRISWNEINNGNISDTQIIDEISSKCKDNELIVLYCTLGARASETATYLINELGYDKWRIAVIPSMVRWGNQRKPLINNDGVTTLIHTFAPQFGNLYVLPQYRYCC